MGLTSVHCLLKDYRMHHGMDKVQIRQAASQQQYRDDSRCGADLGLPQRHRMQGAPGLFYISNRPTERMDASVVYALRADVAVYLGPVPRVADPVAVVVDDAPVLEQQTEHVYLEGRFSRPTSDIKLGDVPLCPRSSAPSGPTHAPAPPTFWLLHHALAQTLPRVWYPPASRHP